MTVRLLSRCCRMSSCRTNDHNFSCFITGVAEAIAEYGSGLFDITNIITDVIAHFSSDLDLEEVKEFFKTRDAGSGNRAVQQAIESIQINSDWLKSNKEEVQSWLNANKQ